MKLKVSPIALAALMCALPACASPMPEEPAAKTALISVAQDQDKESRPKIAILDLPLARDVQGSTSPASSLVDALLNLPISRDVQGLNEARTAKLLATMFITEFVNQGRQQVRVIERAQFEKVMAEQNLGQSGMLDTDTAAKIGKILGVKYLVTGQITRFATKQGGFSTGSLLPAALALTGVGGSLTNNRIVTGALTDVNLKNSAFTARLDMRVIEVETGEIIGAEYEEGESKKMGVKIMGAGTEASFDDTVVGKVFEPIVKKITPKLIQKIVDN